MPDNPEKYLLEVLFTFSQYVKELFLGSRPALALLLATSLHGFASGKQDSDKKKSWGPDSSGVTTFYSKMVGPRLLAGVTILWCQGLAAKRSGAKPYTFAYKSGRAKTY
jgi:hypothetical protein